MPRNQGHVSFKGVGGGDGFDGSSWRYRASFER